MTEEAKKVAVAEEKARKAEEKEATRVKAINQLAALHMPVDGVVKMPHPSAKIFEQCEACWLSQASSMLVIKGESPMAPYKHIKPAETPSITLDPNVSPKLQQPTGEISDIKPDDDNNNFLCDTKMPTEEEKLEVLAIVNRKLKEIEATREVNVAKEKKNWETAKKAVAKTEVKARKEQEKAEKAATKAKEKEEEKQKMEKKAEKEVVKGKGKVKPMANTVEQPNPEVTINPK